MGRLSVVASVDLHAAAVRREIEKHVIPFSKERQTQRDLKEKVKERGTESGLVLAFQAARRLCGQGVRCLQQRQGGRRQTRSASRLRRSFSSLLERR